MGMKLKESDLLPGERLILSKGCNSIISVREAGLTDFAADKYMWAVGMKGKEAIGGNMHLTNYRLLFKSHKLNRVTGKVSIFLPVITDVQNTSRLVVRQMSVCTDATELKFIIWGIPKLMAAIEQARAELMASDYSYLGKYATEYFDRCGDGMEVFGGLEKINQAFLVAGGANNLVKAATNPWQAASAMITQELVKRIVADPVNKQMNGAARVA
jgi:hypothetical protein